MTKEEFKYIWVNKIATNAPWNYNAKEKGTRLLYLEKLIKFKKEVFSEAVDRLLDSEEGRRKTLPSVGTFLQFCRWVAQEGPAPKTEICPCCCGESWIRDNDLDKVVPCDCNYNVVPKVRISNAFSPDKKCELGECDPEGFVFPNGQKTQLGRCPKGKRVIKNISRNQRIRGLVDESMPRCGE